MIGYYIMGKHCDWSLNQSFLEQQALCVCVCVCGSNCVHVVYVDSDIRTVACP